MDRFEQFAHKVLIDMDLLPGRKLELLTAALRATHERALEERARAEEQKTVGVR